MSQNKDIQSELVAYSKDPGEKPVGKPSMPAFEGEIHSRILEEVGRNLAGPTEYMLLNITPERVRFSSIRKQNDEVDVVAQSGEIPAEEWISFSLGQTDSYTALVKPYQGIVKAFTSADSDDIVRVSCAPADYTDFNMSVKEHELFDSGSKNSATEPQVLDVFNVGDVTTPALRNPCYDSFELNGLEYDSTVTLENTFELKKWLRSNKDGNAEANGESVILVALSTRDDSNAESSVVSFTEFCVDTGTVVESLVLTIDSSVSSVRVTSEGETDGVYGTELLPDEHEDNRLVNFAFYDASLLKNVFKHVLKESLQCGDFKIQFSHQYPLHVSHVIKSVVDVETKSIATTTLSPVMVKKIQTEK